MQNAIAIIVSGILIAGAIVFVNRFEIQKGTRLDKVLYIDRLSGTQQLCNFKENQCEGKFIYPKN